MIELRRLQHHFQAYLMGNDVASLLKAVVTSENIDAQKRLLIYANAYRLRLEDSLKADFPTLHALLGDELFSDLCYEYIKAHPSQNPSIRWFGEYLQIFLEQHAVHKQYPYLSEMTQFEWALSSAFDAKDAPVAKIDHMAKFPPESWSDLIFFFHPSMKRLNLIWNVVEIRKQAQEHREVFSLPQKNKTTVPWLIWRQELTTHYVSLTDAAACAIDLMHQGANFGEVCEALCEWMSQENVGPYAGALLRNWLESGLIGSIECQKK